MHASIPPRRGYAERHKIYGSYVTGKVMNVFVVPQVLGSGERGGGGVQIATSMCHDDIIDIFKNITHCRLLRAVYDHVSTREYFFSTHTQ